MKLHGNGGTLVVTQKATVNRYKQDVCFSKDAITNKNPIKNLIKQYQVTYDSIDQIFVVHMEEK